MPFIKIDEGIQILQLKTDQKFLLFSLSFSECFHVYLKAHSCYHMWVHGVRVISQRVLFGILRF